MSGFVAPPPTGTGSSGSDALQNDGWFPDLTLSGIRHSIRTDGTVTDQRLRDSVLYAMGHVNQQLAAWKLARQAEGAQNLGDVEGGNLGGGSRLALLYRRAVCASASADVMERYRNFDSTASAERRALDNDPSIAEQMRNARWAVRDILGQPHATVELI